MVAIDLYTSKMLRVTIPIIYDGNKESLEFDDLPLELPELKSYLPTNDGLSPLARNNDWVNISINGKNYLRGPNTMHNGLDHVGIF